MIAPRIAVVLLSTTALPALAHAGCADITAFGARSGNGDSTGAIQSAIDAAGRAAACMCPRARSMPGRLTLNGVTLTGDGAASVIGR